MSLACWSCAALLPANSGDFCRACGQRIAWRAWEIQRALGAGGNGAAFLAEKQGGPRAVLKLPGSAMSAREHQMECRNLYLAASLGVAPTPLETAPDGLLMEYLPAPTGMAVLERARRFLGAVNRLHNRELVHRDLKPENIVGWQLIDLGAMVDMARDLDTIAPIAPIGTPGYAAPEAYRRQISAKLDAYAAAWVLIEWLGGPEPDPRCTIRAQGMPMGWTPPIDPVIDWHALLAEMLHEDAAKRLSVGLAFHRLTGAWCELANGTRLGSDLVTVAHWHAVLPDAPCRDTLGYATELREQDMQRFLAATGTRLPTRTELAELSVGTRRQSCLRPAERMLSEGLVSDLGARHCRRMLWQPTSEHWLVGGTAYADQDGMAAPTTTPNAMIGLRVAAC